MSRAKGLAIALAAAATVGSGLAFHVAAHALFDRPRTNVDVAGNAAIDLVGLLPGDSVTRVITLRATGSLTYRLRTEWSGSGALARALDLTLTDSTGRVLYRGPLDAAHGRGSATGSDPALDLRMADGQVEPIAVRISLPLSAGNDVQGAEVSARLIVEGTERVE